MSGVFPSREVWRRRPGLRPVDLLVFAALLALLFGLLQLAPALNAPFLPKTAPSAPRLVDLHTAFAPHGIGRMSAYSAICGCRESPAWTVLALRNT